MSYTLFAFVNTYEYSSSSIAFITNILMQVEYIYHVDNKLTGERVSLVQCSIGDIFIMHALDGWSVGKDIYEVSAVILYMAYTFISYPHHSFSFCFFCSDII